MSYCINPNCYNRHNSDELEHCKTCGTQLLINERYQIVKPLRTGQAYNSEVFEVTDFNEPEVIKVLKTLSIKHNHTKFYELFEQEARILIWLSSKWQTHPGIPKVQPDGYFSFSLGKGYKKLQCLVMEKIEGKNLEQWLEDNQPITQKQALNWLQQLVEILDKVHCQGLWHRDIKPSNIMLQPDGQLVLIDFGAVGVGETRIISADYTPPEQIEGKTVLQSDFFALGRTFVYLLTGVHPSELPQCPKTQQLIWQNLVPNISPAFAQLIDDLMAVESINRPQSTQDIYQRIQSIDHTSLTHTRTLYPTSINRNQVYDTTQLPNPKIQTSRKLLFKVLGLGSAALLLGLLGTQVYEALPCQTLGNFKTCLATSDDNLSLGEEILIPGTVPQEKRKGVAAFREGQYKQAIKWFEEAQNNQKDPETLIYLNNAQIEAQKSKYYTIAVAAPLNKSSEGLNSGLEILRGVAQAQNEFNQAKNKIKLKVLLAADDVHNPERAKQIAKALVNQAGVLAVVGHFTSDSTLGAAEIYQQNQLVFISPTSTSEDLSAQGKTHRPNFFFRTVPSDRVTAQTLANYLSQHKQQKVALFYNRHSYYSDSLQSEFRDSFTSQGGTIVHQLDLSTPFINLGNTIDEASQQGAQVLALFPNSQNSILNKTRKLINANQCRHFIVGGDTIYTPDILDEVGQKATDCLIVAVPWHSQHSPNPKFPQEAQTLWGGPVSWRTALTYDAVRVLISALEQSKTPSRMRLQQILSNPNFQTTGATGKIQFQPNGDRQEWQMQLIPMSQR